MLSATIEDSTAYVYLVEEALRRAVRIRIDAEPEPPSDAAQPYSIFLARINRSKPGMLREPSDVPSMEVSPSLASTMSVQTIGQDFTDWAEHCRRQCYYAPAGIKRDAPPVERMQGMSMLEQRVFDALPIMRV